MIVISTELLDIMEVIVSVFALLLAIYQFFNIRKLKKIEKKLVLYSRFFYLESLFSVASLRLEKVIERESIALTPQEMAKAYKLDDSVPNIISEISELSYCCFDRMSRETAKKVQDFLGVASETYSMLNSYYGVIEKGNISQLKEYSNNINKMTSTMKIGFNNGSITNFM